MRRTKAFRRAMSRRAISRKNRIIKATWYDYDLMIGNGWLKLHQLDKGKIHCSCPMCTEKVSNHGWNHADLKKIIHCNQSIDEWKTNT